MMFLPPALAEPFLPRLIDQPEPEDEVKVYVPLEEATRALKLCQEKDAEIRELKAYAERLKKDRDAAERANAELARAALKKPPGNFDDIIRGGPFWKGEESARQYRDMIGSLPVYPPAAPQSSTTFIQGGPAIGKTAAQSTKFLLQFPTTSVSSEKAQELLEDAMKRYREAPTEWARQAIEDQTYTALWGN